MKLFFATSLLLIIAACQQKPSEKSGSNEAVDTQADSTAAVKKDRLALRASVAAMLQKEQDQLAQMNMQEKGRKDTVDCGTFLTMPEYDQIEKLFTNVCEPEKTPDDTVKILNVPVAIHFVTDANNARAASDADLDAAMKVLNQQFRPAKIRFTLHSAALLKLPDHYDLAMENDSDVLKEKVPGVLNIFIFHSIRSVAGWLNGYTNFIKNGDFVMITGDALRNNTTLPHETGHYFLLYHTHGKTNTGTTDEMVDGDNCSCGGDDVCDTPADPNLFGNVVDAACRYIGGKVDGRGQPYKPDPTNLMSYAHRCRLSFTKGQYNRMRWAGLKFRNYIMKP